MSHSTDPSGRPGLATEGDRAERPTARSEWDVDTDVLPPEYGRQLLRISRQLKRAR